MTDVEYVIRGRGSFQSKDIERIVIAVGEDGMRWSGTWRMCRSAARCTRGVIEKNGEGEVVGGVVVMRYGANARDVIERVKERLAVVSRGLPKGVVILPAYDRSELIARLSANPRRCAVGRSHHRGAGDGCFFVPRPERARRRFDVAARRPPGLYRHELPWHHQQHYEPGWDRHRHR